MNKINKMTRQPELSRKDVVLKKKDIMRENAMFEKR